MTLAPLAVHPDWPQLGIGSALARQSLERGRGLGHRIVAVIGHPTYYPRFGFTQAGPLGIAMTHGMRQEAKMVLELTPGALEGVTGTVHFPSIFDDGTEHPK